jgi:hypothetical protein
VREDVIDPECCPVCAYLATLGEDEPVELGALFDVMEAGVASGELIELGDETPEA